MISSRLCAKSALRCRRPTRTNERQTGLRTLGSTALSQTLALGNQQQQLAGYRLTGFRRPRYLTDCKLGPALMSRPCLSIIKLATFRPRGAGLRSHGSLAPSDEPSRHASARTCAVPIWRRGRSIVGRVRRADELAPKLSPLVWPC